MEEQFWQETQNRKALRAAVQDAAHGLRAAAPMLSPHTPVHPAPMSPPGADSSSKGQSTGARWGAGLLKVVSLGLAPKLGSGSTPSKASATELLKARARTAHGRSASAGNRAESLARAEDFQRRSHSEAGLHLAVGSGSLSALPPSSNSIGAGGGAGTTPGDATAVASGSTPSTVSPSRLRTTSTASSHQGRVHSLSVTSNTSVPPASVGSVPSPTSNAQDAAAGQRSDPPGSRSRGASTTVPAADSSIAGSTGTGAGAGAGGILHTSGGMAKAAAASAAVPRRAKRTASGPSTLKQAGCSIM